MRQKNVQNASKCEKQQFWLRERKSEREQRESEREKMKWTMEKFTGNNEFRRELLGWEGGNAVNLSLGWVLSWAVEQWRAKERGKQGKTKTLGKKRKQQKGLFLLDDRNSANNCNKERKEVAGMNRRSTAERKISKGAPICWCLLYLPQTDASLPGLFNGPIERVLLRSSFDGHCLLVERQPNFSRARAMPLCGCNFPSASVRSNFSRNEMQAWSESDSGLEIDLEKSNGDTGLENIYQAQTEQKQNEIKGETKTMEKNEKKTKQQ